MKIVTFSEWTSDLQQQYEKLIAEAYRYNLQQGLLWYKYYRDFFIDGNDILFVAVIDSGKMIGCIPLEYAYKKGTRYWKLKVLQPLGIKKIDFYSFIARKKDKAIVIEKFFEWLKSNSSLWDEINLMKIPESSLSIDDLSVGNSKTNFPITFTADRCFYKVDSGKSWETFYEEFFKTKNKDLLKDLRNIERQEIKLCTEKINSDINLHLKDVMEIYNQRRVSLGQENRYDDEEIYSFLTNIIREFEILGMAEMTLLKDQESNIWAFQLDWIKDKIRYHYHHAYNEEFKKYSPGKILLYLIMKDSFNDPNILECNHMFGDSGYKSRLANESERYISFKIINEYSLRNNGVKFARKLTGIRDKMQGL